MAGDDDMLPLVRPDDDAPRPLRFHQGVIRDWNAQTGANTVDMNGTLLPNVPTLSSTEPLVLQVGDVVGMLSDGRRAWILGRIAVPATPEFFTGGQPSVAAPMYQYESDAATQTNLTDGVYRIKWFGGIFVHHSRVSLAAALRVSGATAVGKFRARWTETLVGSPTWTTITEVTGVTAALPFVHEATYTWPAGLRKKVVYVAFEIALTAGSSGVDWMHAMPAYLTGHD